MNKKLKEEEFFKLENRIWKTYNSHINAAKRLEKQASLVDLYSTMYTICMTILSVFTLINENKIFGYLCVAISIVVTGLAFYSNTMNYKDRYIKMKDNYLKLGDIYYDCINERISGKYDIQKIYDRYSDCLYTVENHSSFDYLKYQVGDECECKKLKWYKKIYYYLVIIFVSVMKVIIGILPAVLVIYSFIQL